ncbi:MAG: hypothetical protein COC03_00870 [Robiginitomaculum sp.]|nr:MAG: hypothetical protein COC03_00870 [Robiginitomaculum sp.]
MLRAETMRDMQGKTNGLTLKAFVLIGAWGFTILSLFLNIDASNNLFARSGSMLVLVAIIISYQLMASRNAYHNNQLAMSKDGNPVDFSKQHPSTFHHQLEKAAQITAVIGTVIWGYGDLFINKLF